MALTPDADFIEVATGLVDLADLFDDAALPGNQREKLETAVAKILKVADPTKVAAATELFLAVLNVGANAADVNAYLNKNIVPDSE
jgi:hypothetical protein